MPVGLTWTHWAPLGCLLPFETNTTTPVNWRTHFQEDVRPCGQGLRRLDLLVSPSRLVKILSNLDPWSGRRRYRFGPFSELRLVRERPLHCQACRSTRMCDSEGRVSTLQVGKIKELVNCRFLICFHSLATWFSQERYVASVPVRPISSSYVLWHDIWYRIMP